MTEDDGMNKTGSEEKERPRDDVDELREHAARATGPPHCGECCVVGYCYVTPMVVIVSVVNGVSSMSDDAPPAPRRSILHCTPYRGRKPGGRLERQHPTQPASISRTHLL